MGRFLGKPNLQSFPNAAKRGMKIYSSGEMSRVKGFERLYLYYWNKKAEEICSNVNFRKWTKTAIEGVIATEWALKKTPLIFSHSQRLLREDIKDPSRRRQKKGTVKEGALTMLNAHKNLLKVDEKLRKLKSAANTSRNKKMKIQRLEDDMKVQLTELQKRQEAVRKSLENMAKEKGVKNSEMIEKMENEVTTKQLDHTTIKALIDAVVEEADSGDAVMDDSGLKGEDSCDGDEDDEKHSADNYEREDRIGEIETDRQDGEYSAVGSDSDGEADDGSSDLHNEASDASLDGSDLDKETNDAGNDLDNEASDVSVGGSDLDKETNDAGNDLDNEASDVSFGGSDLDKETNDAGNDLDNEASDAQP